MVIAVWHGHHEADSPLEFLEESFESRMRVIETTKTREESPKEIQRRKQLFKLADISSSPLLVQAQADWDKALADWNKARADLDKVRSNWEPQILALHAIQCGCGWTKSNRNIFEYLP